MTDKIEQPRNINPEEISLIKATFTDELLKSVRAVMLGLDVTAAEKAQVKGVFSNPKIMDIMVRRFYPKLDKDMPIGQVQDVWLGVEQMIYGESRDTIYQAVHYKAKALELTKKGLGLLVNPDREAMDMDFVPPIGPMSDNDVSLQVGLLARNQYIRHVESQLLFLSLTTKLPDETPEKASKRAKKDSAE